MIWTHVDLSPKTKRARQIVRDHGKFARVVAQPRAMQCFDNREGIRIRLMNGYERNIETLNDKHFDISRILWESELCLTRIDGGWCDRDEGHAGDHCIQILP